MASESSLFSSEDLFSTPAKRQLIDGILNTLIPPNADRKVPGAGDLGIAGFLRETANSDEGAGQAFSQLGNVANEMLVRQNVSIGSLDLSAWTALVAELEKQQPASFELLLRHTYMGYYSRPDTRVLFGLSAQPTQPNGYAVTVEPPDEMASLTRSVRQRGDCFRSC